MAFTRKSKDDATAAGDTTATSEAKPAGASTTQPTEPAKPAAKPAAEAKPAADSAKGSNRLDRSKESKGSTVKAGANVVRSRIASVIWLIAVVCALCLAVGALLVALKANQDNAIVSTVLDVANWLDGPFSRDNGLFTFDGKNADTKSALVNWGLGAVAYLVVGKIFDRVIRP